MEARILEEQERQLAAAFERAFKKEEEDRLAKQVARELKAKLKTEKARQKADNKRNPRDSSGTSLCEWRSTGYTIADWCKVVRCSLPRK